MKKLQKWTLVSSVAALGCVSLAAASNSSTSFNLPTVNSLETAVYAADFEPALIRAAQKGDLDKVKRLIEEQGAKVDARDDDGETALHAAAEKARIDFVKYLVKKGADVNAKDDDGETPLHAAADEDDRETDATRKDRVKVVKFLLDKGADVAAKDRDGETPAHVAADAKKADVLKVLLDKKSGRERQRPRKRDPAARRRRRRLARRRERTRQTRRRPEREERRRANAGSRRSRRGEPRRRRLPRESGAKVAQTV